MLSNYMFLWEPVSENPAFAPFSCPLSDYTEFSRDYLPSQAVTEQSSIRIHRDTAVVVGIFRVKSTDKGKPYSHRERFVDAWVKTNRAWQCVATTSKLNHCQIQRRLTARYGRPVP